MAVFGQGAPGVRIQLRDLSQIDLVTEPIVTGGIVGFSSRGELNKIIDITSTADMDVILGPGFNNPQYNQGLYAARAVVQSGGFVEFVRPYGEVVIQDDNDPEYPFKQNLKTDTYLVEYNFTTPANPTEDNIPDSFATTYMAATRYIDDLLTGLGEREINTISKTISSNTNTNFFLDTDEVLLEDANGNDGDAVSLFAIMNSDPTAARRAGDRFDISSITLTAGEVTVITKNTHGLSIGDTVYITGTTSFNGSSTVVGVVGAKMFTYTDSSLANTTLPEQDGAVYINEDTIQSGVDYLEVKTAARGMSSKQLGTMTLDAVPFALNTPTGYTTATVVSDTTVTITAAHTMVVGDLVNIEAASKAGVSVPEADGIFEVTAISGTTSFTYTIVGETLGPAAIDLAYFAQLTQHITDIDTGDITVVGKESFKLLLADGTQAVNEYVVMGQSPVSPLGVNEIGPIGIPVIKSNATSNFAAETFDSSTGVTTTGFITLDTPANIANFSVGDTVAISNTNILLGLPDKNYTVAEIVGSALKLLNVDTLTPTVGGTTVNINNVSLSVTNGGLFTVGDTVRFEANFIPGFTSLTSDFVVSYISGNSIALNDASTGLPVNPSAINTGYTNIVNLSAINDAMISEWSLAGLSNVVVRSFFDGTATPTGGVTIGTGDIVVQDASRFEVGNQVMFHEVFDETGTTNLPAGISSDEVYNVASVNLTSNMVSFVGLEVTLPSIGTFQITNLSKTAGGTVYADPSAYLGKQVNFLGVLGLNVPESIQNDPKFKFFTFVPPMTPIEGDLNNDTVYFNGPTIKLVETTNDIMLDSTVGRTFLSLGLANEDYIDVDFDGDDERVFRLTSDGFQAARFFLFCEYFFAGTTYNFAGTIVPFVVNDVNLYIGNSADDVANGWTFQINQNASLQAATEDSAFDLAQSVKDGIITSEFAQIAFNESDPAIVNDAVWQYNPIENRNSAALAESWNLFLDRDNANADMLISAGTAIQNLFVRGFEQIDYNVMDSMLNVCEKRKDLFSIFDGVDAPDINVALRKMVGVGSQGEISRWGGIFDGRDIFFDADYTKLNVQGVKSISVCAIITLNRAGNVYWLPPAGYNTGRIPAQYSLRQKYLRSYNYAADPVSDIAKLYDANINPTRVNDQGQFIYGQKTMLKRGSALNRMNVIMLIAGIHKRFENYLDYKVFQLNTAALRNNIQSDLQAQLELIKSANPQGITAGKVICDETNNTPDIIDSNQLIVDVVIQPTRAAEYITLRTTVQRTGADLDVTNTILGG